METEDFFQHETQQLFSRAINQIKVAKGPMDENALGVRRESVFHNEFITYSSDFDSLSGRHFDQKIHKSKRRYHHGNRWTRRS